MKIETILATKGPQVITVRASQSLQEVIDLLDRHNIGALVVVDDAQAGKPVGILSERDVVRALALARSAEVFQRPASGLMTKTIIVGSPHDDVASVMHTMTVKRFRHLPIIDQGKLVGIVSIGDMVKAQLEEYQGAFETLQTQLTEGE
jgi:CBS domain-containing protein